MTNKKPNIQFYFQNILLNISYYIWKLLDVSFHEVDKNI